MFFNVGSHEDVEVPKVKSYNKTVVVKKKELLMVMEDIKWRLDLTIWKENIERKEIEEWVCLEGKKMLAGYVNQGGTSVKAVLKVMNTGRKEDFDELG